MSVLEIICGIVMIIASLVIIAVIMLQESKQANGLDAVTGTSSSDNYLGRNGGNTKEAFLAKLTKILAVVFMVVAFGITLLVKFVD